MMSGRSAPDRSFNRLLLQQYLFLLKKYPILTKSVTRPSEPGDVRPNDNTCSNINPNVSLAIEIPCFLVADFESRFSTSLFSVMDEIFKKERGILSGLGNVLSQIMENRRKDLSITKNITFGGPIRFGVFGLVFTGPLSHYFYLYLDKLFPSNVPYSQIKRLLLDRLMFAPAFLALFFVVISLLEGKNLKALKDKMKTGYWIALKMNWKVWTIFQYININYVPVQFRVLFANLVALFWYAYLASIRR